MAANLVRRYRPDVAHHLLNLSFAQYRADSDVVRLEAQLERAHAALVEARTAAACERGDVDDYRRLLRASEESARQRPSMIGAVTAALERVRPGDVLIVPGGKSGGRVAVLSTTRRRGGDIRVRAVTPDRRLVSLGSRDFPAPPEAVAQVGLPVPYAPHNAGFQRQVASALAGARLPTGPSEGRPDLPRRQWRGDVALAQATVAASHPVAGCPDARAHLRALERADRLVRDIERLERRVKGRVESLARQFDRVLRVLEAWGYVDGWSLTAAGDRLARTYHESDLLVAECASHGLLDGLDPAELAGLVSVFTYETRGPGEPTAWFPTARLRQRWADIDALAVDLNAAEDEAGLPLTRRPDPGFIGLAHAWAAGEHLAEVIAEEEISGGDFVRNVKQLIDLVRQLADLAPDAETARAARLAADQLFRGVVAASSVVGA
jgi:ATP-dependent RNA helicase HelY